MAIIVNLDVVMAKLLLMAVICVAFSTRDSDDFDASRREVLLRRIGHELLLQSGDSTSRVLPVKKIAENEYRITFENELAFEPEGLMDTTRRLLSNDPFASDYVVNVLNCGDSSVAYGYAMSENKKDDIVPCGGRKQPSACYLIDIKFKPAGIITAKNGYLLGSLSFLAVAGFIFLRSVRSRGAGRQSKGAGMISLGSVLFDARNRKLVINGKAMPLTATETRILLIFALSPNLAIERNRL